MKHIKVADLEAGMRFSESVFVDGNNLFVPKGLPIKQKDIERLQKWGISEVSTEGERLDAVASGTTGSGGIWASGPSGDLADHYHSLVEQLSVIFEKIRKNEDVSVTDIDKVIDAIFSLLKQSKNGTIQLILSGDARGYSLACSSVNCAILSVLIGLNLRMVNHKLIQLATGALLHDVGMLRIPDSIVMKQGNLSDEELQRIRTHPVHAYRIITRELKYPEEIGQISLQHHERWDGEGYPKRLAGDRISIHARIVAVADAFEAMIGERPYRNSMIGYVAMRNLLSDNSRRFDPDILRVFIKSMGIYPIGSIVLLNDASIGRVISSHEDAPLRPELKILIDELGKEFKNDQGKVVDLLHDRQRFIARAVNPRELLEKAKR